MASAIVFLLYGWALWPLLAAHEDSKTCVFPFVYNGTLYYSCTREGTESGRLWCSTTEDFDLHGQWRWCRTQEYGGNSNGKPCHFPYNYLGKTYYTCTTKNSDKPWCAVTDNYFKDREWSHCADTRKTGPPCVFPFYYNGTFHTTCIIDGTSDGKPWCSETKNYDVDQRKVFCEASARRPEEIKKICYFPFVYKNKTYSTCTTAGEVLGRFWCSLTSNYNEFKEWKYCDTSDLERACSKKT